MIKVTYNTEEKLLNRPEYVSALQKYFDLTEGLHTEESEIDRAYWTQRLNNSRRNKVKSELVAKISIFVFSAIITSAATSLVIIWGANKVFNASVEYSISNVFVLMIVFIIAKTKVQIFK